MDLTTYKRRQSLEVRIGEVLVGGENPVVVQSMTNTDTNDTAASVAQIERLDRVGCPIVRLTAQGRKEGENLKNIVAQLRADGFRTAVVADIHFVPEVASIAAESVDKVRINPGNYRTLHGELEALIEQCRRLWRLHRPAAQQQLPLRLLSRAFCRRDARRKHRIIGH